MKKIKFLLKYLRYYFTSQPIHNIHSPFVYELLTNVLEDENKFYAFDEIEKIRNGWLNSKKEIEVTDFGAGSSVNLSSKRKIKDIAKHSAKSAKYGQLLFRVVNYFQPKTILELGTSIGISSLYLSFPNKKIKLITIEGCPEIAKVASTTIKKAELKNIELIVGNFDTQLPLILKTNQKFDFIFIDGNHRKEPTLNYFRQCLQGIQNNSIIIFDDIHWSDEMEEAWEEIKKHPQVTVTIDLFFIGLVFFRKEQMKQDFVVWY